MQNAEAQIVSCFSFTFHVAERVEGKKGRKKESERRVEERERKREKGCGCERGNERKRERERNHDGEDGGARLSAS